MVLGAPAVRLFMLITTDSSLAQLSSQASVVVQAPAGGACTIFSTALPSQLSVAGVTHWQFTVGLLKLSPWLQANA